jgi:hypothetical protein
MREFGRPRRSYYTAAGLKVAQARSVAILKATRPRGASRLALLSVLKDAAGGLCEAMTGPEHAPATNLFNKSWVTATEQWDCVHGQPAEQLTALLLDRNIARHAPQGRSCCLDIRAPERGGHFSDRCPVGFLSRHLGKPYALCLELCVRRYINCFARRLRYVGA